MARRIYNFTLSNFQTPANIFKFSNFEKCFLQRAAGNVVHVGGLDVISAMTVPDNKNCGFHKIGALFPRARASTDKQEKQWKNISPDRPKGCPTFPGRLQNGAWRHVRRRKKALDKHEAARNRARCVPDATGAAHERNTGAKPLNF